MDALKEFYTRQRSSFLSYLIRRTGDYELSCDILQESFLRLFERYGAERLSPQLLYTVGRNMVIDRMRKRPNSTVSIEDHDGSNTRQEHQLLVREEYRQVLAAMRHLEDDERDLLSLLISSGMGYRDLAAVTGFTETNIKVKIHRARKKLKELSGDWKQMSEQLISQFIDDELSLDEKITFVNEVGASSSFEELAVGLLVQEKLLRAEVTDAVPEPLIKSTRPKIRWSFFRPFAVGALAGIVDCIRIFQPIPSKCRRYRSVSVCNLSAPSQTGRFGGKLQWLESSPLKTLRSKRLLGNNSESSSGRIPFQLYRQRR